MKENIQYPYTPDTPPDSDFSTKWDRKSKPSDLGRDLTYRFNPDSKPWVLGRTLRYDIPWEPKKWPKSGINNSQKGGINLPDSWKQHDLLYRIDPSNPGNTLTMPIEKFTLVPEEESDELIEWKYGLSVELKRETQKLFKQRWLEIPNNSEMDEAGDSALDTDKAKTPKELMDRIILAREAHELNEKEPYNKYAASPSYMHEKFPEGCTDRIIFDIYQERFGESPGVNDRIPIVELQKLVDQKLAGQQIDSLL